MTERLFPVIWHDLDRPAFGGQFLEAERVRADIDEIAVLHAASLL